MADFLTNLASRTLGLMPVAQPMMASMFAPDTQTRPSPPNPLSQLWERGDQILPLSQSFPRGTRGQETRQRPRGEGESSSVTFSGWRESVAVESLSRSDAPKTTQVVTTVESKQALVPNRSNDARSSGAPKTAHVVTTDEVLVPNRSNDARSSSLPKTPRVVTTDERMRALVPNRSLDKSGLGAPKTTEVVTTNENVRGLEGNRSHESSPSSSLRVEMRPKRLLMPHARGENSEVDSERAIATRGASKLSYDEPKSALDFDTRDKSEAPTIRVTIGRIEVRAQQPVRHAGRVPQRSARTRPQPTLSLNDYLKQRAGGR